MCQSTILQQANKLRISLLLIDRSTKQRIFQEYLIASDRPVYAAKNNPRTEFNSSSSKFNSTQNHRMGSWVWSLEGLKVHTSEEWKAFLISIPNCAASQSLGGVTIHRLLRRVEAIVAWGLSGVSKRRVPQCDNFITPSDIIPTSCQWCWAATPSLLSFYSLLSVYIHSALSDWRKLQPLQPGRYGFRGVFFLKLQLSPLQQKIKRLSVSMLQRAW